MKHVRLLLATSLAIIGSSSVGAQTKEAYAVLTDNKTDGGKTLTFYYNENKPEGAYSMSWRHGNPGWYDPRSTITTVTFDKSFEDYDGLKSTRNMFNNMTALKAINHLEYLNTSKVKAMDGMFSYCEALTSLDLSNFNTEKVTDMSLMFSGCKALKTLDLSNFKTSKVKAMDGMFYYCSKLETIYCNDSWYREGIFSSYMFDGCDNLVGDVAYDNGYTDVSMANPTNGYFTAGQAYAVVTDNETNDGKTLTFYYDESKAARQAEAGEENVFDVPWDEELGPDWAFDTSITTVEFDKSFANFRLTSKKNMFICLSKLEGINDLEQNGIIKNVMIPLTYNFYVEAFLNYAKDHQETIFHIQVDEGIEDSQAHSFASLFWPALHMKNIKLPTSFLIILSALSAIFPWEDVKACMDKKIPARANHLSCPSCGKTSENLEWIEFRSPTWTWQQLCGRSGPLSICPDCHCQVEFICEVMN